MKLPKNLEKEILRITKQMQTPEAQWNLHYGMMLHNQREIYKYFLGERGRINYE